MAHAALSVQHWLGGVERKTLQIPGFEIAYLDGGSGEPLVMVHGIGADKDNWAQIAPFLRGTGRLIALDLPGFGDSGKPTDDDYSIVAQADRPGQFIAVLKLPPAPFPGNSTGAPVVLEF